ncbi:hypothetical protein DFR67_103157 [Williamsia limnetica]|uniref:Uncharacterized protein n=1 Tax=Williamsia limnetica TaxID=882452 RepID=A0A318RQ77_WILLI|nr:hypothetical protein [Williamsia limnetica]PYE19246.1 hypothetical protein DFR67_103157 [Williamsia limnetica]
MSAPVSLAKSPVSTETDLDRVYLRSASEASLNREARSTYAALDRGTAQDGDAEYYQALRCELAWRGMAAAHPMFAKI